VSVDRNDAVQTNENAPAHTQLAIDRDLPFKVLALSIRPAVLAVYSCVAVSKRGELRMSQWASTRKLVREFECAWYDPANVVLDAHGAFDDIDTRSRKELKECIVSGVVGSVALDEDVAFTGAGEGEGCDRAVRARKSLTSLC